MQTKIDKIMIGRPRKHPLDKVIQIYSSIPISVLNNFPTPTHARLYAEQCLKSYNPNINTCPKPPKLANFKANQALQKFIKNSNNPQI